MPIPKWLEPYIAQGQYQYTPPTYEDLYSNAPGTQAHAAYNQQYGFQPVIGYDGQPVAVNPVDGVQFPGQQQTNLAAPIQQGVSNAPVNQRDQQYTDIFGNRSSTGVFDRQSPSGQFRLQDWNSFDDLRNRFGEFRDNFRNQLGQARDTIATGNYSDLGNFQSGEFWRQQGYGGPNTKSIAGATGRGFGLSDNSSEEIREAKANNVFYTSSGVNISNVPPGMSTKDFVAGELAKVASGQGSAYYDPARAQGSVASLDSRVADAQAAQAARQAEDAKQAEIARKAQEAAAQRAAQAEAQRAEAEANRAARQDRGTPATSINTGGGSYLREDRDTSRGTPFRNMGDPNVQSLDDILGFNQGGIVGISQELNQIADNINTQVNGGGNMGMSGSMSSALPMQSAMPGTSSWINNAGSNAGTGMSNISPIPIMNTATNNREDNFRGFGNSLMNTGVTGGLSGLFDQTKYFNMGTPSVMGYNEGYPGEAMYATGTDSVPAVLTPGEAVIPASAAQDPMYKPIIKEMIMEGRKDDKMWSDIFSSMDDVTITKKKEDGNTITIKSPAGSLMVDMFNK